MPDKTVAQKLGIKPDRKVVFVNAPQGYDALLGALPDGVTVLPKALASRPADLIQVFVASRKELETQLPKLKKALAPGGALWVTYHKGTSQVKTDINRDSINAYANTIGMQGVAMISVDEDWAALRLKAV